jgi:hypothetical protein
MIITLKDTPSFVKELDKRIKQGRCFACGKNDVVTSLAFHTWLSIPGDPITIFFSKFPIKYHEDTRGSICAKCNTQQWFAKQWKDNLKRLM